MTINIYPVITTILIKMVTEKDIIIIKHLRKNARKKITHISRQENIPVTTIYDRIRSHERKGIVRKHTSLLDFSKLGFNAVALIAFKVAYDKKEALLDFLNTHPNINSLYRVNLDHDFLAEVVFENMVSLQEFIESTSRRFTIGNAKVFNIISELKKEKFLARD